jgi:hypothetical protein
MAKLPQVSRLLGVTGAQAIPLGGVLGFGWGTATGLALYWVESLLLVIGTVVLIVLLRRQVDPRPGEEAAQRAERGRRREEANRWKLKAGDVFGFHFVSVLGFGFFLGGVVFMVTRGAVAEAFDAEAFERGLLGMVACVGLGVAADAWRIETLPVAVLGARVQGLMRRWLFLWLVGFVGAAAVGLFGAPLAVFAVFGVLKALFELLALAERTVPGMGSVNQPPRSVYEQRKVTLGGSPPPGGPAGTLPR